MSTNTNTMDKSTPPAATATAIPAAFSDDSTNIPVLPTQLHVTKTGSDRVGRTFLSEHQAEIIKAYDGLPQNGKPTHSFRGDYILTRQGERTNWPFGICKHCFCVGNMGFYHFCQRSATKPKFALPFLMDNMGTRYLLDPIFLSYMLKGTTFVFVVNQGTGILDQSTQTLLPFIDFQKLKLPTSISGWMASILHRLQERGVDDIPPRHTFTLCEWEKRLMGHMDGEFSHIHQEANQYNKVNWTSVIEQEYAQAEPAEEQE